VDGDGAVDHDDRGVAGGAEGGIDAGAE
jgi:hypothetical protein